ncbi:hypothetical protein ACLXBB_30890, partial [Pseudomonas aeruginosa]
MPSLEASSSTASSEVQPCARARRSPVRKAGSAAGRISEPLDGAVHAHPDQADDEDADEHDVEHEQLPALHHQVADALAGS